jgi:hypothetical protein
MEPDMADKRKPQLSEIANPAQTLRRRMADAEDEALSTDKTKAEDDTPKGKKSMSQADFTAAPGKRRGILNSVFGD